MQSENGIKIILTEHASKRLDERWDWEHTKREIIYSAFDNGERLSNEEMLEFFEKGIVKDNYWTSTYRAYRGKVFVFRSRGRKWALITVFPRYGKNKARCGRSKNN